MWRHVRRWSTALLSAALGVGLIVTAPLPGAPLTQQLMTLSDLPDEKVDEYLQRHPDVLADIASSQADDIDTWWRRLSKKDRREVIDVASAVVGNLGGIDFVTRDRVNRAHLLKAMARAERKPQVADAEGVTELGALKAISQALSGKRSPKRYLITLTRDSRPLAAVAIGDLSTAKQIVFAVPGMGSYTTDMPMWTQAAQNVWDEQWPIGAPEQRAVVAWIGYVTPPQGVDAALGEYAARGAPRLIGDLRGVTAVRRHDKAKPAISVVAHSYGSTMSASALASERLGIYAFVMVGSAGVESRIGSYRSVRAAHVYAAEASSDELARWGRASRTDPRSPAFGAKVLEVDGDADRGLRAVTGHAPVLHSKWNDDPNSSRWNGLKTALLKQEFAQHQATAGYFDLDTESLRNIAIVTTPSTHTTPILAR